MAVSLIEGDSWVGLVGAVIVLDGVEPGDRFVQYVAGDGVVVDVEREELRPVERAALWSS